MLPACATSTASHNTVQSTRTYSRNRADRPSKKRKILSWPEQVQLVKGLELDLQDLQEYPELRQAARGQWPPLASQQAIGGADKKKAKEDESLLIPEMSHTFQPDGVEQQHLGRSFQDLLDDPGFAAVHSSSGQLLKSAQVHCCHSHQMSMICAS